MQRNHELTQLVDLLDKLPRCNYLLGEPPWRYKLQEEEQKRKEQEELQKRTEIGLGPSPGSPSAMPVSTGGAYVGLNIGGVTQTTAVSWSPNREGFGEDAFPLADAARTNLGRASAVFGGTIGYDWPLDKTLWGAFCLYNIGLAVDVYGNTGSTTRNAEFSSFGVRFPIQQHFSSNFGIDGLGRFGVPLPVYNGISVRPFVTGGLALKQVRVSDKIDFLSSFNGGSASEFRAGWAVGGGLVFNTGWPFTIEVQGLYRNFGAISYVAPNNLVPNVDIATKHRFTEVQGTIGVRVPLAWPQ